MYIYITNFIDTNEESVHLKSLDLFGKNQERFEIQLLFLNVAHQLFSFLAQVTSVEQIKQATIPKSTGLTIRNIYIISNEPLSNLYKENIIKHLGTNFKKDSIDLNLELSSKSYFATTIEQAKKLESSFVKLDKYYVENDRTYFNIDLLDENDSRFVYRYGTKFLKAIHINVTNCNPKYLVFESNGQVFVFKVAPNNLPFIEDRVKMTSLILPPEFNRTSVNHA